MKIWLSFPSNDDNGNDTEKADYCNIEMDCEGISLARYDEPITFRYEKDKQRIKVGRRYFPAGSYVTWLGNMAYNGVVISIESANQIAEYLRGFGFVCEQGISELFDAYHDGKPIDFASVLEGERAKS